MSWQATIHMLVFTTIAAGGGLLYAWYLARNFDRRYGQQRQPPGE